MLPGTLSFSPTSKHTHTLPVSWQMGTPSVTPMRAFSRMRSSTPASRLSGTASSRAASTAFRKSGRNVTAHWRMAS